MATGRKKKDTKKPASSKKKTTKGSVTPVKAKSKAKSKPKTRSTGYREYISQLAAYSKREGVKYKGRGGFAKRASEIWSEIKDQPGVIDNLDVLLPNYLLINQEVISYYTDYYTPRSFYYWDIKPLEREWNLLSWKGANDRLIAVESDGGIIDVSTELQAASYYKEREQLVKNGGEDKYEVLTFDSVQFNENNGYDVYLSWVGQSEYKPAYGIEGKTGVARDLKKRKEDGIKEKQAYDRMKEVAPEHVDKLVKQTGIDYGKTDKDAELESQERIKKLELESKEKIADKLIAALDKQFEAGKITFEQYLEGLTKIK